MKNKKILAVASGGGHWKQLMLLKEAFNGGDVKYITTVSGLPEESGLINFAIVSDSNKGEKRLVIKTFLQLFWQILKFRPDVVITTGAAPGLLALSIGRMFFAQTIWVDSFANAEQLSLAGNMSKKVAHITITQWEHLSEQSEVQYKGSVF